MKNTYKIFGMTCNGCKTSIETSLGNIVEIKSVLVDLGKERVVMEMEKHIPLEKLQKTLLASGLHYTIETYDESSLTAISDHSVEKLTHLSKEENGIFLLPDALRRRYNL